MSLRYSSELRRSISGRLGTHARLVKPDDGLRRAAVALVVLPDERDRACVVLTRRAAGLRNHGGQFALPGGSLDAGESAVDAALRELHEEVGLACSSAQVLGCLDDHITQSGYHLTPVVVEGAGGELRPCPDEVAEVYRVPLDDIANAGTRQLIDLDGDGRRSLALAIIGTLVFAPTAALLLQLGRLAVDGVVERVDHYQQPRFAWR